MNEDVGRMGEEIAHQILARHHIPHFQIDWMARWKDKYHLLEVKHQDIYEPPPFYGHGLPLWQIQARLSFCEQTGVLPYLWVVEKSSHDARDGCYLLYRASLLDLEEGEHVDTQGLSPRRIYNIHGFKKTYYPMTGFSP